MAKKSFKEGIENPAMQFISLEPEQAYRRGSDEEAIPEGYKLDPKYVEKKTRRVQLLLKPSIYDKAKSTAEAQGKSLNDFINNLLEKEL